MLFYIFIEIKNCVNEFIIENKNKKQMNMLIKE